MKKRVLTFLLLLALITPMLAGPACASSGGGAVSEARNGVVRVLSLFDIYYGDTRLTSAPAVGSAFGVGKAGKPTDTFVTNRHVVGDSSEEWPLYLILYFMQGSGSLSSFRSALEAEYGSAIYETDSVDYKLTRAYLLLDDYAYTDATGLDTSRMSPCTILYKADADEPDLAVLRSAEVIEGRVALPLLSAKENLNANDDVRALGFPASADFISTDALGNQTYYASVEHVNITNGVVSQITYSEFYGTDIIVHTASINGGNSGGPLVTEKGAVVGVNTVTFNGDGLSSSSANHYGSVTSDDVMAVLDAKGIQYETYGGGPAAWLIILIVVIVAAVVVVLLLLRKKGLLPGKTAAAAPAAAPAYAPPTQPAGPAAPAAAPAAGDSGLRFQAVSGVFAGKRFAIGPQVRIGREPSKNDFVYPPDTQGISGVHCMLTFQNGQLCLTDLGSTYGTFVGAGTRLAANQPVVLREGDRFYLGSEKECFVITGRGGV